MRLVFRASLNIMLNIVLFQPQIPPNTGNIIRLAANNGSRLHLIEPLGFNLEEKQLRRAGLDYHDLTHVNRYADYDSFLAACQPTRLFAITTKGKRRYTSISFKPDDYLLFGSETSGLPDAILSDLGVEKCLRIPMCENNRSLNLSNSVAIVSYEAWRQCDFAKGL